MHLLVSLIGVLCRPWTGHSGSSVFALLSLLLTLHRSQARPPTSAAPSPITFPFTSSTLPSPTQSSLAPSLIPSTSPQLTLTADPTDDWRLRETILEELGFHGVNPSQSFKAQSNISREEYKRAYTQYMLNVRTRKEGERGERDNAIERRKGAKVQIHSIQPLHKNKPTLSISSTTTNMRDGAEEGNDLTHDLPRPTVVHFPWTLPVNHKDKRERILIKRATLYLPHPCTLDTDNKNVSNDPTDLQPVTNHTVSMSTVDMTMKVIRWMEDMRTGRKEPTLALSLLCNLPSGGQGQRKEENERDEPLLEILWIQTCTKGTIIEGTFSSASRRSRRSINGHGRGRGNGNGNGHGKGKRLLSDFEEGKPGNDMREKNRRIGKRKGKDCENVKRKSCCRKSLKVSFADLKITDVVLAPAQFDMGYCDGRCEARRLPYATNHAIFQAILIRNKGKDVAPKLCCTPTSLSDLDVIQRHPVHMDQLQVTVIHHATVKECGCS